MVSSLRNIVILISGNGSNMAAIAQAAQRDNWQQRYGARVAAEIESQNMPDDETADALRAAAPEARAEILEPVPVPGSTTKVVGR